MQNGGTVESQGGVVFSRVRSVARKSSLIGGCTEPQVLVVVPFGRYASRGPVSLNLEAPKS